MGAGKSPLHKLLQQLIAEEKLDPRLAKKLLDEILAIIIKWKGLDDDK